MAHIEETNEKLKIWINKHEISQKFEKYKKASYEKSFPSYSCSTPSKLWKYREQKKSLLKIKLWKRFFSILEK